MEIKCLQNKGLIGESIKHVPKCPSAQVPKFRNMIKQVHTNYIEATSTHRYWSYQSEIVVFCWNNMSQAILTIINCDMAKREKKIPQKNPWGAPQKSFPSALRSIWCCWLVKSYSCCPYTLAYHCHMQASKLYHISTKSVPGKHTISPLISAPDKQLL